MIDIHSHIIFGVDDGPKSLEESIHLLEESYRQGVRAIVATSHRRKGMFETPEHTILEHFHQLQAAAKRISDDLFLFYGAEIYYTSDIIGKLEKKQIPTYGDTQAVLIEFGTKTTYKQIHEALGEVIRSGFVPVVAHIERYDALEDEAEKVAALIDMGCYMQVNSSSILKPKLFNDRHKTFKRRAQFFLENDLVHFVASDMHNLDKRRPYMEEAYQLVEKQFGSDRAKQLFMNNPLLLLKNKL